MRKLISTLFIFGILFSVLPTQLNRVGASEETYFIVTAYYSPLPNQDFYLKGNYEDEKKLNGQGIRGASGKGVFSGMLAGPKNYAFGTKIQLEGLGIGSIEDRGGAIVNAGQRGYNYDRIDLWVGYGDEGLKRALYWGKRKVKGKILKNNTKTTINYKKLPSPDWTTKSLMKIPDIFSVGLSRGSNKEIVKNLQKFLKDIGLYEGEINGIYNAALIDTIYKFQIEHNLLDGKPLTSYGYWGTKTRNLILKKYLNGDYDKDDEIIQDAEDDFSETDESIDLFEDIFSQAANTPGKIKRLQELLGLLGLYEGEQTGVYSTLRNIILNYQLENEVILNKNSIGAGYFGPKTRKALKETYKNYLEESKRQKEYQKRLEKFDDLASKEADIRITTIGRPVFGEVSSRVRELQLTLIKLGFFDYDDTAIFGKLTKQGVLKYQLDRRIVNSASDRGAGIFGPKTRQTLKDDLKKIILQEYVDTGVKVERT